MQPPRRPFAKSRHPGVKHVLAVASGKGASASPPSRPISPWPLHMLGRRVGLLDADIYGPSIPIMMGITKSRSPTPDNSPSIVSASSSCRWASGSSLKRR